MQGHRDVHWTYLQLGGHKGLTGHCFYSCMAGSYLQISGGSQNIQVHTYTEHRKAKKHSSNPSFTIPCFPSLRHHSWVTGRVTQAFKDEHVTKGIIFIPLNEASEGRGQQGCSCPPTCLCSWSPRCLRSPKWQTNKWCDRHRSGGHSVLSRVMLLMTSHTHCLIWSQCIPSHESRRKAFSFSYCVTLRLCKLHWH